MAEERIQNLTGLTVELLSAYVSNNTVASEDLSALIGSTHAALLKLDTPEQEPAAAPEHVPAVSIRKSLASPHHIISLIDGKPYKTLKRHLARHGLTWAEYRERYNLPASYPAVAPAYSEHRRAVATALGLGRRNRATEAPPQSSDEGAAPAKVRAAAASEQPASDQKPARKSAARKSVSQTPKVAKSKKNPASSENVEAPVKATPASRRRSKVNGDAPAGEKATRARRSAKAENVS